MFQMFKIEKMAEIFMENRWLLCQILFAGYMIVLAVMDIRIPGTSQPSCPAIRSFSYSGRAFLRQRSSGDPYGSRSGNRHCISDYQ